MNKKVMVTGASGYIGMWLVKQLLEKGYSVNATVRDKNNDKKTAGLKELANGTRGKLELFSADLLQQGAFDEAAAGCEVIYHVASPFTLKFKDAQKELIDPALEGTRNVLSAANKNDSVKKVVLTSSVAAVHGDNADMKEQGLSEFTEEHFNTSGSLKHQPYSYSKVLAEKEAWKLSKEQNRWQLVVINPSFVMGPALSGSSKSGSLDFMNDITSGKYAMGAPYLMFGFVDVRDVAKAHILAAENDKAEGRYILAERTETVMNLTKMIEKLFPGKFKLPKMPTPKFMMYLAGPFFGLKHGFIKRNVGYSIKLNNSKSIDGLGLKYTSLEDSIKDMINSMI